MDKQRQNEANWLVYPPAILLFIVITFIALSRFFPADKPVEQDSGKLVEGTVISIDGASPERLVQVSTRAGVVTVEEAEAKNDNTTCIDLPTTDELNGAQVRLYLPRSAPGAHTTCWQPNETGEYYFKLIPPN